jgi:hypothetical protein
MFSNIFIYSSGTQGKLIQENREDSESKNPIKPWFPNGFPINNLRLCLVLGCFKNVFGTFYKGVFKNHSWNVPKTDIVFIGFFFILKSLVRNSMFFTIASTWNVDLKISKISL